MAASRRFPAHFTEFAATMPPKEMTATSMVPPPISTIICPRASWMGMPAPMAARIGSFTTYAFLAPDLSAASMTARFSVEVTPKSGHRYHYLGLEEIPFAEGLADVVAQHRFRHAVVGDDAVLQGPVRGDSVRRAP